MHYLDIKPFTNPQWDNKLHFIIIFFCRKRSRSVQLLSVTIHMGILCNNWTFCLENCYKLYHGAVLPFGKKSKLNSRCYRIHLGEDCHLHYWQVTMVNIIGTVAHQSPVAAVPHTQPTQTI